MLSAGHVPLVFARLLLQLTGQVSTHHLLRVAFMVFSAPLVFALLQKRFAISE